MINGRCEMIKVSPASQLKGRIVFPLSALMINARLLMLLLAGSAILPVISLCGNVRRWLIDLKIAILSTKLSKNLQVTKKSHNFAPTKQGTGCSAVGSAHVWGARGRKFESCHPDLKQRAKL